MERFIQDNMFFMTFWLFWLGAIVGSFLNVCIWRLPEEKSIVTPRSACRECATPLKWYHNIPIVSFVLLGGKCEFCKKKISLQYILVEVLTGYFFVEYFVLFGASPTYVVITLLTCLLLVSTIVDFRHTIIPDETNFFGMGAALILSALFPSLHGVSVGWQGLLYAILGLLAGGGIVYLTAIIGDFVFKKDSMGGGDVKLMAMMGAFLGWKYIILTFFLAPFFALPIALYVKFVRKDDIVPYGPFLSIAGLVCFFAGDSIMNHLWGTL